MVKLVEYPDSSEDEHEADARSDDGSQWSSIHQSPSSPSDSFSYPMRSADSDEEDEDYAPSEASLQAAGSVAGSVDTDDLDPDNDMDEEQPETTEDEGRDDGMLHAFEEANLDREKVIDLTQEEEGNVFYAWKDLQKAFEENPFKRRNVEQEEEEEEEEELKMEAEDDVEQQDLSQDQHQTDKGGGDSAHPNWFDVEAGRWSFQAAFAPGVAEKKTTRPYRRRTPTGQHRPTGVSPRFSTLFTGKTTTRETASPMQAAQEKQDGAFSTDAGRTSNSSFAFQKPQVDTTFSFGAKHASAPKTPDFTFGQAGSVTVGDDTHMQSPSPRHPAAESFAPTDGGFTIGRSSKAPKPYNFAGDVGGVASKFSASDSKAPNAAKDLDDGDDALMRSPSPQVKPSTRTPTNAEFLFGQGYKNRKTFAWGRQGSSESFHSSDSASAAGSTASAASSEAVKPSLTNKLRVDGSASAGRFCTDSVPTPASAFFTPGVAARDLHHQNSNRRKKKVGLASVPPPKRNSSTMQFGISSSISSSFGSSLFRAATASHQRPETSFSPAQVSADQDEGEAAESTARSFVFGSSNAKTSTGIDPPHSREGAFGSASRAAAPASLNAGTPGQFLFGTGTSRDPFEFAEAEANSHAKGTGFRFTPRQARDTAASTTDGFRIGSTDPKRNSRHNPRVRPRRSGMFANKSSPRKDVKLDANEPEPSPGFASSSSTTPSPFGLHNRRSRKNARLRQTTGCSPPADPFVTPTYQSHAFPSMNVPSEGEFHPNVLKPTARQGHATGFGAPPASASHFGARTADPTIASSVLQHKPGAPQPQNPPSNSSGSLPNELAQPAKSQHSNDDRTRPAFAGSRRILRAALRSVGVRGDRPSLSLPHTMGNRRDEGDVEIDSEDERDWLELKRLGGVAHCSKQYEDAAEYYRQSIEVLESLLYHNADMETTELRTDKAKLHANRAASLMMLMQITEAQHECRRSIEVDATYARAYLRLGRIQVQLGDTAHAQANIDTARQLMEGQGGEISSGDQADHASLVKMDATIKKLTMLQGEIKWYVDCGDFKQALVHTESALALAPSSRKLQVQKARILLHQREFDQIVEFCSSIVDKQLSSHRKPSSPAGRGRMNGKPRKDKAVEEIAFIGIELGLLWATTLHYNNKVEDAVRILSALEVVAPCSSNVIQLKQQWLEMKQLKHNGNERFKRGEYQEALRFYSEGMQIDPQHQEYCAIIYCNRAAAQMGLERYHTAILDCNEALQRKPDFPRALLRRARCHVALKMYHEAVKDFDRYLRAQPNDVSTEATAAIRRERNEAKAAIARAREEARQREAAKKRAEREQRQRRSHHWEDSSWSDSRFNDDFRRGASSSNGSSYGSSSNSRHQSSGAGARASFMAPKTQRRTHYDVLGIEKSATSDHIKKTYRKLALVYHPDKAKTSTHADLFKEMTAAYNVLSDESARAKYDRELIYNRFGNFYEN